VTRGWKGAQVACRIARASCSATGGSSLDGAPGARPQLPAREVSPDTPFTSYNRTTENSRQQYSKAQQSKARYSEASIIGSGHWKTHYANGKTERQNSERDKKRILLHWIQQACSSSIILVRQEAPSRIGSSFANERHETDASSWTFEARSSWIVVVRPDTA
jgi:hypothetical protein